MRRKVKTDADIVRAVWSGDTDAFERLIQRYQQPLYALALSRLRDPQRAREAVSETFVRAYLSVKGLREPDKAGPWLRAMLHNYCLKQIACDARETVLEDEHPDPCPDPQMRIEQAEETQRLVQALHELPPRTREPVLLHYFFGFGLFEIADWMGIPVGTVKSRLHEGRAALKARLGEPPIALSIRLEQEIIMKIKHKNIPETRMEHVNLRESEIQYVDLNDSIFRNVDFSGSDFEFINIDRTRFRNTGGADGTPASDVSFEHCTMQRSRFTQVDMTSARFNHVGLKGATLQDVDLRDVSLENCQIEGLQIDGIPIKPLLEAAKRQS
jgi:RNA polymerase sigma-70 factor (ECF subfamily)